MFLLVKTCCRANCTTTLCGFDLDRLILSCFLIRERDHWRSTHRQVLVLIIGVTADSFTRYLRMIRTIVLVIHRWRSQRLSFHIGDTLMSLFQSGKILLLAACWFLLPSLLSSFLLLLLRSCCWWHSCLIIIIIIICSHDRTKAICYHEGYIYTELYMSSFCVLHLKTERILVAVWLLFLDLPKTVGSLLLLRCHLWNEAIPKNPVRIILVRHRRTIIRSVIVDCRCSTGRWVHVSWIEISYFEVVHWVSVIHWVSDFDRDDFSTISIVHFVGVFSTTASSMTTSCHLTSAWIPSTLDVQLLFNIDPLKVHHQCRETSLFNIHHRRQATEHKSTAPWRTTTATGSRMLQTATIRTLPVNQFRLKIRMEHDEKRGILVRSRPGESLLVERLAPKELWSVLDREREHEEGAYRRRRRHCRTLISIVPQKLRRVNERVWWYMFGSLVGRLLAWLLHGNLHELNSIVRIPDCASVWLLQMFNTLTHTNVNEQCHRPRQVSTDEA